VFRYQAMQDVLKVLFYQHYPAYSVSDLATLTNANRRTNSKAVEQFPELDVIETEQDGRTQQVQINREGSRNRTPFSKSPKASFTNQSKRF
jgi:predicted transcriptional regulator